MNGDTVATLRGAAVGGRSGSRYKAGVSLEEEEEQRH